MNLRIIIIPILLLLNTDAFAGFVKDTTIKLGEGFVIKATRGERYVDSILPKRTFTTYSAIRLIERKKIIFSDTTSEYQLDGFLSPFFRKIGTANYEFLIEVNDRPNINYFLHIIIGDTILLDTIHADIANSPKLNHADGSFELCGISCDNGVWGEQNNPMTGYAPILYYDFRKDGIVLDTAMTIKANKEIYGKFEGYKCNNSAYPEKMIYKKEQELKTVQ